MEWWMIGLIMLSGMCVGSLVAGLVAGRLSKKMDRMYAKMVAMEEERKSTPPRDTPLRVPYQERLKAEYERRGMKYVPPVTSTDG